MECNRCNECEVQTDEQSGTHAVAGVLVGLLVSFIVKRYTNDNAAAAGAGLLTFAGIKRI